MSALYEICFIHHQQKLFAIIQLLNIALIEKQIRFHTKDFQYFSLFELLVSILNLLYPIQNRLVFRLM